MSESPSPYSPLNYATPAPPGPAKGTIRFRKGLFGWLVFVGIAVILVILVQQSKGQRTEIPLNQFHDQLLAGQVLSLTVEGDAVIGEFRSPISPPALGVTVRYFRTSLPAGSTGNWAFTDWLLENRHGAQINVSNEQNFVISFVAPLIPWIVIFGCVWLFVLRKIKVQRPAPAPPALPAGPIEVIIVSREPK
jgi:ATP-dependent Zn protease